MSTSTKSVQSAPLIYSSISAIMREIKPVGKDHSNPAQRYQFRSIDDVADMLQPLLAKFGVFIAPNVESQTREERSTKSGSALSFVILTVRFDFFGADGSKVSVTTVGEGMDSGDKASNKAMSAAFKYALLQTFCIPTSDQKDSEFDSPEVVSAPANIALKRVDNKTRRFNPDEAAIRKEMLKRISPMLQEYKDRTGESYKDKDLSEDKIEEASTSQIKEFGIRLKAAIDSSVEKIDF